MNSKSVLTFCSPHAVSHRTTSCIFAKPWAPAMPFTPPGVCVGPAPLSDSTCPPSPALGSCGPALTLCAAPALSLRLALLLVSSTTPVLVLVDSITIISFHVCLLRLTGEIHHNKDRNYFLVFAACNCKVRYSVKSYINAYVMD